jgi:hypothetical protein
MDTGIRSLERPRGFGELRRAIPRITAAGIPSASSSVNHGYRRVERTSRVPCLRIYPRSIFCLREFRALQSTCSVGRLTKHHNSQNGGYVP